MSTTADPPLVRQLSVADLTDIVELQETVTAGLPVGFIRSKAESKLRAYLDGTLGVAYGVVEGAALSATSLLRVPDENHPNNGLPFLSYPKRTGRSTLAFSRTRWSRRRGGVDISGEDEVDMRQRSTSELGELGKSTRRRNGNSGYPL